MPSSREPNGSPAGDRPRTALLIGTSLQDVEAVRRLLLRRDFAVVDALATTEVAVALAAERPDVVVLWTDVGDAARMMVERPGDRSGPPVIHCGPEVPDARCWEQVPGHDHEAIAVACERAAMFGRERQERVRLQSELAAVRREAAYEHRLRAELDRTLKQSQAAAQTALRAKSAFLANMGHELRTPLNAILGYAELLQEEARELGADALVDDLGKVHRSAHQLIALIDDVLALARIESGRAPIDEQHFSVSSLCEEAAARVAELAARNEDTLTVRVAPEVGSMFTDRAKVGQCLYNLLSNACKFTEAGEIELSAEREQADGREWVTFRVRDTGIGLSEEHQKRVFEEFTQADESTTRRHGGTGLGLALTRRIAELLTGHISLDSVYGRGATFVLRIPDGQPAASRAVTERPLPRAAASTPPRLRPPPPDLRDTVLVIDDDPVMRYLLDRYLSTAGYRVVQAASGAEGVQLAEEHRPSVVCLDVAMPDMDGWSTLKALKARRALNHIPVVMLSAAQDKTRGADAGASAFLVKPVQREVLLATVRQLVDTGPAGPVLVVEDDLTTRELTARTLRQRGWEVEEAENGAVALRRMRDRTPSLVVLDLMMPELDGFGVVAAVRRNPHWRAVPIVVMTALDLPPSQRSMLELQVEAVIGKAGFDRAGLLEEVERHVRAHAREVA